MGPAWQPGLQRRLQTSRGGGGGQAEKPKHHPSLDGWECHLELGIPQLPEGAGPHPWGRPGTQGEDNRETGRGATIEQSRGWGSLLEVVAVAEGPSAFCRVGPKASGLHSALGFIMFTLTLFLEGSPHG